MSTKNCEKIYCPLCPERKPWSPNTVHRTNDIFIHTRTEYSKDCQLKIALAIGDAYQDPRKTQKRLRK